MYIEEDKMKRIHISNPFIGTSLSKRLKRNNSIDLRNNAYTIDHRNGYNEIKPINLNKLMKADSKN